MNSTGSSLTFLVAGDVQEKVPTHKIAENARIQFRKFFIALFFKFINAQI
jgi:hypothetical protein